MGCRRIVGLKDQGCERSNGGRDGGGGSSIEKGWFLQACRRAELEAQAEACNASAEGHQPVHEGALRLQSEAGIKDSKGVAIEEDEDACQLGRVIQVRDFSSKFFLCRGG